MLLDAAEAGMRVSFLTISLFNSGAENKGWPLPDVSSFSLSFQSENALFIHKDKL